MTSSWTRQERRRVAHALAIIWSFFILVALSMPGDSIPRIENRFPWTLPGGADKVVHTLLFASEMVLLNLSFSLSRFRERAAGWALGIAAPLALVTEGLQAFIPDRSSDWRDLVANFLGLALGWGIYTVWRRANPADENSKTSAASAPEDPNYKRSS